MLATIIEYLFSLVVITFHVVYLFVLVLALGFLGQILSDEIRRKRGRDGK